MEKEIKLLSRLAVNNLFLAQLELFRASIASLYKRSPRVALLILQTVVAQGGRFNEILWSRSCPSPSHLVWFSTLELLSFTHDLRSFSNFDADTIRLKAEFVLLLHLLSSRTSRTGSVNILGNILNFGFRSLGRCFTDDSTNLLDEPLSLFTEKVKQLKEVVLLHAEIFDALCCNVQKQLRWSDHYDWGTAITIIPEDPVTRFVAEELEALRCIQKNVQIIHLGALTRCLNLDDEYGFIAHLRYLHLGHGVDESDYRLVLQDNIKRARSNKCEFSDFQDIRREKWLLMYAEAISSNSMEIVQAIQVIEDKILLEEIERHRTLDNDLISPLRDLHERFEALDSLVALQEDKSSHDLAIKQCMRELYHYARVSGFHIMECVMDTVLSAVRRENFQEASNFLSVFPLLQPLVAVMGWDLLHGNTAARRKLMVFLWTSKSQVLRLEEFSKYGKKSDEVSCVEYLCDVLCYRLDIASFVHCINSGGSWDVKSSLLIYGKDCEGDGNVNLHSDSFAENLILERLVVESPLRVLFDVVPGIKFQDALELVSMQPISSTEAAVKRMQDIELMHMRYVLESIVCAIGCLERSSGENEVLNHGAMAWLMIFKNHLEAIRSIPRKIMIVSVIISLLHIDDISMNFGLSVPYTLEQLQFTSSCDVENGTVISFMQSVLQILCHSLSFVIPELKNMNGFLLAAGQRALEWRISNMSNFLDDWEWRLSVLEQLWPISVCNWTWKEVLAILRAAPSNLLNLCMQRAKYDIGEEAVKRFSLPLEDKATLELAEWLDRTCKRASVEDAVSRIAEGLPGADHELDFLPFQAQLGSMPLIFLFTDAAATASRSVSTCRQLLGQAQDILSEIYPGAHPKLGSYYWDQIREMSIISVLRHILKCLQGFLELDRPAVLQSIFAGETKYSLKEDSDRHAQRLHGLSILHQMIDDAYNGKRQFLSGKLHNLARAIVDEEMHGNFVRASSDMTSPPSSLMNVVLGLGLRLGKSVSFVPTRGTTSGNVEEPVGHDIREPPKSSISPLNINKASTYLSSFILYIANIGDIVDGADTTHDFNFFSIIYDWPNDLLTRLVFEQSNTDAAGKVAELMNVNFVHEVIYACVPPIYPPMTGRGWGCLPILPMTSKVGSADQASLQSEGGRKIMLDVQSFASKSSLYPLRLDIVRHLVNLSPVRGVLACAFGSGILHCCHESSLLKPINTSLEVASDSDRLFYEFALDQSERFPTLNRWIQIQSNLHRVSENASTHKHGKGILMTKSGTNVSVKRARDHNSDSESEVDDNATCNHVYPAFSEFTAQGHTILDPGKVEEMPEVVLSFDYEDEEPYEMAVDRLINEGKLTDALALSDRCLKDGASDRLLELLIERCEEECSFSGQSGCIKGVGSQTESWRFVQRLKDKQLAARLAFRYLHSWDLDAAIDILTMCNCHLPEVDPINNEVFRMRQALLRYNNILRADDQYKNWQEVESECKKDPEGMALRLAGKGAVSAALEVAESSRLSIELRWELQGRQLVKLLTTDPLCGGGPAQASRFLSSLQYSDDALSVAVSAMQLLSDLRSKKLLVHFFLKRKPGNQSCSEVCRLNKWALGLQVLENLPLPWQQRCSGLHDHPHLILEVLLMRKQLRLASMILKEFPSLRDDNLVLKYAGKAIVFSCSSQSSKMPVAILGVEESAASRRMVSKSNFTSSFSSLKKEARRAFSWAPHNSAAKVTPKDLQRKRKCSGMLSTEGPRWGKMMGTVEDRIPIFIADVEQLPSLSITEEWLLTGDEDKDKIIRLSHKYGNSIDVILFKALLSLCSDEVVSAKGALHLCITQMKNALSSEHLPLHASMETIGRAYLATEAYVQCLLYVRSHIKEVSEIGGLPNTLEKCRGVDDANSDAESSSSCSSSQYIDELSQLLLLADIWVARAELLQSLLGSGIVVSLSDIADSESSACLRDRLISDERYSMAVYTCKKCKIDAFPVWNAWGHALIRLERYAEARVKFKQALQLYRGDPTAVITEIINTIEGGSPVDLVAVNSMYEHLAKSALAVLDDSLSTDAYLNVLHMPSTFPRAEKSKHSEDTGDSCSLISDFHDFPCSSLDSVKYAECVSYLQEFARHQLLTFMFRHGHYSDACLLFFPPDGIPSLHQPCNFGSVTMPSSPQRPDPMATDYGTLDDLCDFCIGYGTMPVLEYVISTRLESSSTLDTVVYQHTVAALVRICSYCENHKHFNYLYKFQVVKKDPVAAGLCCIQLFMNSFSQEEAIIHLEGAKMHFEEALSVKHSAAEATKILSKSARGKSASEKLSEESLVKYCARVVIQVDVVKCCSDLDGPQWKYSLFGNPNDPDTFRRRCEMAESLVEKNFDLAFRVIYEFSLPAVNIYAGVATSLAERKKGGQLTEFLRNIKGTIGIDDLDQVLGAAINVYANKHKERPDRLIDMLTSNHRKVLACVVCGRLKSAFQIASRSGSVADVQYVGHQALHVNALPILDMCKHWLSQYT